MCIISVTMFSYAVPVTSVLSADWTAVPVAPASDVSEAVDKPVSEGFQLAQQLAWEPEPLVLGLEPTLFLL
nr:hypothetical protein BaRGS_032332 [Batillaria attramentaria]